jgi:hypothetical protein
MRGKTNKSAVSGLLEHLFNDSLDAFTSKLDFGSWKFHVRLLVPLVVPCAD